MGRTKQQSSNRHRLPSCVWRPVAESAAVAPSKIKRGRERSPHHETLITVELEALYDLNRQDAV